MVKKVNEDSTLITKVAIGKPGGVSASENWDSYTITKCLLCKTDLGSVPSLVPLVDSILLSNSALFQNSVDAWEKELVPCEHTLTLQQASLTIAEKSLASCGDCELKGNLWLCMSCGHLGCGRKNYDGTGGNSHALEHHKSTKHPLVCKMGTITPEGSASIHCYICDEEVLDPDLSLHLLNFGIKTQSQIKTEKTIAEMELEANLALTLSKAVEEGRILTPRFGPTYTGMENLGNTCYMNSVFQTLFTIPEWLGRFNNPEWLKAIEPASNFHCQMAKLAIGLTSGKHSTQKWTEPIEIEPGRFSESQAYQDGVRPEMLKALLGKGHPEFASARQQDAFEYLQYVLTMTERQEKTNGTIALSPTNVFDFTLRTKIKCMHCNKVRYTDNKQNSISTMIPIELKDDNPNLVVPWVSLLSAFSEPEVVEFRCPSCKANTSASKSYFFKTVPKVLVLLVNRFVCPDWVPKKLECGVEIPTSVISLKNFIFTELGEDLLPEEGAKEPEFNQFFLSQLLDMGLTENQAKVGLIKTNNVSAEIAATWVFENLDNPELNAPIASSSNAEIDFITGMGFTVPQAKYALKQCGNNAERAIDYLFSHQGEMDIEEPPTGISQDHANYQLFSVVTHLGASVHSGHYVAHILKNGECVLYNDVKVAATSDPPLGKGYIYFFRLVD